LTRYIGLLVASRCLWNIQLDRQLTISKQTANVFITVKILLLYLYTAE
ncbi:unnamed protein product, partial [Adineta steineri]